MKLKGIIDFSLGNFLCLRGFAPMGLLQDISQPPNDIQRIPKDERLKEIKAYLTKGELVFFPEVILCASLDSTEETSDAAAALFEAVSVGAKFQSSAFQDGTKVTTLGTQSKGVGDIRAIKFFQTATIEWRGDPKKILSRIDGNHRLEATKEQYVRDRVTPFCLILCRNEVEFRRFSRSLFHNINYKQVPLTMEHNLKLIIADKGLFPDETLKSDPSFGWPYYLARRLFGKLDFELLPNIQELADSEPLCFLVEQFDFLIKRKILSENENALVRFKSALVNVNGLFEASPSLKETRNRGLLGALMFYSLSDPASVASFLKWLLSNNLHLIENSSVVDLLSIFDRILETKKRTIFVSMPFGKTETENHFAVIKRVAKEVSDKHGLKVALKIDRVDWFHDGTSYRITDKIEEMLSNCGLLIADLTFCNPNVYHEIGFVMGKARGEGLATPNMLLFLDESVTDAKDRYVGFNIAGDKQLRFTESEKFAAVLAKNLEKFFRLA